MLTVRANRKSQTFVREDASRAFASLNTNRGRDGKLAQDLDARGLGEGASAIAGSGETASGKGLKTSRRADQGARGSGQQAGENCLKASGEAEFRNGARGASPEIAHAFFAGIQDARGMAR